MIQIPLGPGSPMKPGCPRGPGISRRSIGGMSPSRPTRPGGPGGPRGPASRDHHKVLHLCMHDTICAADM